MIRQVSIRSLFVCLAFVGPIGLWGEESPESPLTIEVEVEDADGNPVAGAHLGISGSSGGNYPNDTTQWHYNSPAISDERGHARVVEDWAGQFGHVCLIARHEKRKLSAVASIGSDQVTEPIKLILAPECSVTAEVTCSELLGRWRPGQVLTITYADKYMFAYVIKNSRINVPLPPGDYEFKVSGEMTLKLKRKVKMHAGEIQTLEPFDLPASNLGLLQGQPAPELDDVYGWKNGPALKLMELRGKCVLLDFFGHWCGPCIKRMPEVMDLYEKYRDQGLIVIGVHTGSKSDDENPIDTVEELDERLASARAKQWQGRDIPYPVALTKRIDTRYRPDLADDFGTARSVTTAKYGIIGYPSLVLIDRRGNVVGSFDVNAEGIKLLEKTLQE